MLVEGLFFIIGNWLKLFFYIVERGLFKKLGIDVGYYIEVMFKYKLWRL